MKNANDFNVIAIQPIDRQIIANNHFTQFRAEIEPRRARARLGHKQHPPLLQPIDQTMSRVDLNRARDIAFSYPMLQTTAELEYRPEPALVEAAMLLTDDHAPVEYYAAQVVRQYDALLRAQHRKDS